MSLLMDALKRAEASKQEAARANAEQGATSGVAGLTLEPMSGTPPAGHPPASHLPDLASHIDALDADLAASAPAPETRRPSPSPPKPSPAPVPAPQPAKAAIASKEDEQQRAAARNAFAAKQAEPPSRKTMWLALGLLGIAAVGIGAYVWYQMQSMSGSSLAPPPGAAALPSRPPAPPAPAPALPVPPLAAAPEFGNTARSTVTAPAALPPPAPAAGERARRAAPSVAEPRVPIRLSRTPPEPESNLQSGYAKLQSGQVEAARIDYEAALKNDPNNVDALLGLAAIAQQQGRGRDAERYQRRAVEANPTDAAAQAAALSAGDPQAAESRLKLLLSQQPESGPLNFALGNLQARQTRWPEAQQAYFNAVAADPDNPDYLFNLAVSLDQIRQPKLAAQHYRLALEAAQLRPAAFDRERVRARLEQLQR
jgi:tetratricopeptide (TPR) repeat protein